jgi:hypothetical protein
MSLATSTWREFLLLGVSAVCLLAAVFAPALAQPLSYHEFADCRPWLSVPNFLNVVSNLPFLLFGALGLWRLVQGRMLWHDPREQLPYLVFFLGSVLTCVGSMYYHWQPDNPRLVWDRLPMTLAFAGLVTAVLAERVAPKWGRRALWPLLLLGAATVFYWYGTERLGRGNVMPYGIYQTWTIAIVLLLIAIFPSRRYSLGGWLWWPVLLYGLAKIAETFDLWIYRATGTLASGHTIKHVLAAIGVYAVLRMLMQRQRLPS